MYSPTATILVLFEELKVAKAALEKIELLTRPSGTSIVELKGTLAEVRSVAQNELDRIFDKLRAVTRPEE
jgi:hypothetical protein